MLDPTLTTVLVSTNEPGTPNSTARGGLVVAAPTDDAFVSGWQSLAGHGRLDLVDK
jgi:hypothetical protein